MKVIIPATKEDCPAAQALRAEGISPEIFILKGPKDYSELFKNLWLKKDSFIVVEHDVIPWPGALDQLWQCPLGWCGYSYPLHAQGRFGGYLGCTKFTHELMNSNPKLWYWWDNAQWRALDGVLLTRLREVTGQDHFHQHYPSVAHLRELPAESELRHPPTETLN